MNYKDTGCEFSPSCLDYPFPACLEDSFRGKLALQKKLRNTEIKRLLQEGKKAKELAIAFGISQRTIQRVVKKCRGDG